MVHAWVFKPYGGDFGVFHLAGERALRGEDLYLADELNPFKYSPAAALFLAPLGLLPARVARGVWALISVLAMWRFARFSARLRGSPLPPWMHWVAIALVAPYLLHHLALGQCDAVLLALMATSEECSERRPLRSGLLWAAACLFKLPYLVFLAPALWLGQWRRLGALFLGLLAGLSLEALRYGGFSQLSAWRALLAATTPPLLCSEQNQSLLALACTYFGAPGSTAFHLGSGALALLLVALMAAVAVSSRGTDEGGARAFALSSAFYLTAFFSPLGWWTNLLALLPMLYLLAQAAREENQPVYRLAMFGSLALLAAVGALNFDLIGREPSELFLRFRHMALGGLAAVGMTTLGLWRMTERIRILRSRRQEVPDFT